MPVDTDAIRCTACPAFGRSHYGKTDKALCFAAGHPTTPVDPDGQCMYGITDYANYLQNLRQEWATKNQK